MRKPRKCSSCQIELEENSDNFYLKNKNNPDLGFTSECKKCLRNRSLKNRNKKINEYRDFSRNYGREHKEEIKVANKKYRNSKKKEKQKYQKEYFSKNKDKLYSYQNDRKYKKHIISKEEWESCKKYFNYQCAYCGISLNEHLDLYGQDFHKEHVDDDGLNDLSNCVPSCKKCNSSKWTFSLNDWYSDENDIYEKKRYEKIMKWIGFEFEKYIDKSTQ